MNGIYEKSFQVYINIKESYFTTTILQHINATKKEAN